MQIDRPLPPIVCQQAQIEFDAQLKTTLLSVLRNVGQLVKSPTTCYLLYAWPTTQNNNAEYWIQIFLSTVYQHLHEAGITPIIDLFNYTQNDTVYSFAEHANMSKYVLIFGTPSMNSRLSATNWQPEKVSFAQALVKQHRDGNYLNRIIPIVLSGKTTDCFLDFMELANVHSWVENNYIDQIKWLLSQILFGGQINNEYETCWQPLCESTQFTELPQKTPMSMQPAIVYYQQAQINLQQEQHYQFVLQEREPESLLRLIYSGLNSKENSDKCHFNGQFQLPDLTYYFSGRTKEMQTIGDFFLAQTKPIAKKAMCLSGIIGVGKSQCVRRFIETQIETKNSYFQHYIWFVAGVEDQIFTPIILHRQFFLLAMLLGYDPLTLNGDHSVYQKVYASLQNKGRSFIVFDHAHNYTDIQSFLPPVNDQFSYCITTNNAYHDDWPHDWSHSVIRPLDRLSTTEFIRSFLREEMNYEFDSGSDNQTEKLSNLCDQHPLMLTQALTYIVNSNMLIEDYLNLWQQDTITLLNYPIYRGNHYAVENSDHHDIYQIIRPAIFTKCILATNKLSNADFALLHILTSSSHIHSWNINTLIKLEPLDSVQKIRNACVALLRIGLLSPGSSKEILNYYGILQNVVRFSPKKIEKKNFIPSHLSTSHPENNDESSSKKIITLCTHGIFHHDSTQKNTQNITYLLDQGEPDIYSN